MYAFCSQVTFSIKANRSYLRSVATYVASEHTRKCVTSRTLRTVHEEECDNTPKDGHTRWRQRLDYGYEKDGAVVRSILIIL